MYSTVCGDDVTKRHMRYSFIYMIAVPPKTYNYIRLSTSCRTSSVVAFPPKSGLRNFFASS